MKNFRQLPKAVQDCHELIIWFIPKLDNFPQKRRFTLGVQIENRLLQLLQLLVDAAFAKNKKERLYKANQTLDMIRHLWRLAFELKNISNKEYEYGAKRTLELGQQIGGWLKSQHRTIAG